MPEPLSMLVDSMPDGVRVAALPTPFAVGDVNCYLLPEPPVTVVDPGMMFGDSQAHLERLVRSEGLALDEIDQIVVTHGHPDHFGAAAWLADESGAPIITGRQEVRKLTLAYERGSEYRVVLAQLGVPMEALELFPSFLEQISSLVRPVDVDEVRVIDDGDVLEAGGREYVAHVTPGHAASHVSLWDGSSLLSGDHLLPRISPNPFLEVAEGEVPGRRRSLIEYLDSLDRFVAMDPERVLPGHGEPFTRVDRWAERVRAHHDVRSAEIRSLVAAQPGQSAYELTQVLFPRLRGFEIMLGVSETVGHLDLLEGCGELMHCGDEPQRWHAV
jgi:glyoxylase-like metal-dependent hydrolase (beta-lactamase superfamily II)